MAEILSEITSQRISPIALDWPGHVYQNTLTHCVMMYEKDALPKRKMTSRK